MPTEIRYEVEPDGDLVVRVPVQWKKSSGRTVAEDAGEAPAGTPLVQAVARGLAWRDEFERGDFPTVKAMAEAHGLDPSNVRHTFNLAFLSPRILRSIATGRGMPPDLSVARLLRVQSLVWDEQEKELGFSA